MEHSRSEVHIKKTQLQAKNAPSRRLPKPSARSLWQKRAGVATLWATHFITIWNKYYSYLAGYRAGDGLVVVVDILPGLVNAGLGHWNRKYFNPSLLKIFGVLKY